jgi:hypothetical protein
VTSGQGWGVSSWQNTTGDTVNTSSKRKVNLNGAFASRFISEPPGAKQFAETQPKQGEIGCHRELILFPTDIVLPRSLRGNFPPLSDANCPKALSHSPGGFGSAGFAETRWGCNLLQRLEQGIGVGGTRAVRPRADGEGRELKADTSPRCPHNDRRQLHATPPSLVLDSGAATASAPG